MNDKQLMKNVRNALVELLESLDIEAVSKLEYSEQCVIKKAGFELGEWVKKNKVGLKSKADKCIEWAGWGGD